jgi:UDP-2-acetamido-2-deoxy-ribo-hexuluronate aminotransferase
LSKLEIFGEEVKKRNAIADQYEQALSNLIETPRKPEGVTSAWAQYTIKIDNRDSLQAKLKEHGVPTAVYYPLPMHLQKAYVAYGAGEGSMPLSEKLSKRVLSLPMNPYASNEDVEVVIAAIRSTLA